MISDLLNPKLLKANSLPLKQLFASRLQQMVAFRKFKAESDPKESTGDENNDRDLSA